MNIYYELNCGQPVLHRNGVPVLTPLDAVGIAFSKDDQDGHIILHKHGSPELVKQWYDIARAKTAGLSIFDEFHYIEIKVPMPPDAFPVEQLNEAIAGNRRALSWLSRKTQ